MYLTGLTHRDRLFDVASRWLADRVEPDDGATLTEIFAFERAITAPSVRALVADLSRAVRPGSLVLERVSTKDAVREAIIAAVTSPSRRARQLLERYRRKPEEFFPRTPVHMSLITRDDGSLAGMVRRKRIRRIADKVSRLMADQLAGEIDAAARQLAAARARDAGLPLEEMVSSSHQMDEDFTEAERLVADQIRSMELTLDPERQQVDDVIGIKMIATPSEIGRLEIALDERENTWAFHRKIHEGPYVGTHYRVEIELPPVQDIVDRLRDVDWSFAAGRGVSVFDLENEFYGYVTTGSRTFSLELILTTMDDLVESEFGRSLHEVRILEQRDRAGYSGRIAQNASWIIEYMLCHAISPTAVVDEVPIKIYGRYLRDTFWHAVASLRDGEPDEWLVPVERTSQRTIPL
jgi:hypothetical protein